MARNLEGRTGRSRTLYYLNGFILIRFSDFSLLSLGPMPFCRMARILSLTSEYAINDACCGWCVRIFDFDPSFCDLSDKQM
jgi:hypothetical protein